MSHLRRTVPWLLALAPPASLLLLLPLSAQEKSPPASPQPPPAQPAPAPEPAKDDELPPDERVSADNNLSFPVDI